MQIQFTGAPSEMKTYYLALVVRNLLDKNIDLKMRFSNGTDKTIPVPSSGVTFVDEVLQSNVQPDDIDLYAVQSGTVDKIVLLNNNSELSVTPTVLKTSVDVVAHGDSGKCLFSDNYCWVSSGNDKFDELFLDNGAKSHRVK